jgi:hypothetical protein
MRIYRMTVFAAFIALSLTGMALPAGANMVVISSTIGMWNLLRRWRRTHSWLSIGFEDQRAECL